MEPTFVKTSAASTGVVRTGVISTGVVSTGVEILKLLVEEIQDYAFLRKPGRKHLKLGQTDSGDGAQPPAPEVLILD